MNRNPVAIIVLVTLVMSCNSKGNNELATVDSASVVKQARETNPNEDDNSSPESRPTSEEGFLDLSAFLSQAPQDTNDIQTITTTCAIVVERTKASVLQDEEMEAQQEAERQARRAKMTKEELALDDSLWEDENSIVADDAGYYNYLKSEGLNTLAALEISTITALDRTYVRLIDSNKKEWVLDIRGTMEQGWTAIFFHIKKEPKVIGLTDINKEVAIRYFLMDSSPKGNIPN